MKTVFARGFCCLVIGLATASVARSEEQGLVGHWKIVGGVRDSSGNGLDATNHNVDTETGEFNGRDAYLEIPASPKLQLGDGDFAITASVYTDKNIDDELGDIVTKFDPAARRGFNFTFTSNTSGYNSEGNTRNLFFGLDNATTGKWADVGRPGGICNSSDALTVFNGDLYVGTVDAPDEADWAHVYRYRGDGTHGDANWEDCGRVGTGKVRGVYAMIVHDGALYAATAGPHGGDKINKGDFVRVYRYAGGKTWDDIGQPGEQYRINSLASYNGKLYALAIHTGGKNGAVYVYDGDQKWTQISDFGRAHTSGVHDGRLYVAYPKGEVFAYDGKDWEHLGNPYVTEEQCNQLHAQGAYRGEWFVGTWPFGKVSVMRSGKWVDLGRMGDSTEVVGLTLYNGSLYAGAIPRAEVFRYDGPDNWVSIRRLFDPPNYDVVKDVEDWSRASSMTVYQGKMFVSTADCFRAALSKPRENEIRGKVYTFSTGQGVSVDHDLGPGWKQIAAVRSGKKLQIYVDGKLAATSESADAPIQGESKSPLQIGFGPHSYFHGKMRDVRLYNRALPAAEVAAIH